MARRLAAGSSGLLTWPAETRAWALSASNELAAMAESAEWPVGFAVPVELGGTGGRRRFLGGVWRARDVLLGELGAKRMLRWAGGMAAVDLETRDAARLRGSRMLALALAHRGGVPIALEQAAALLGWRRQVALREPGRRMAVSRMTLSRVDRVLVGSGLQPDGRGRWAVERVLEVQGAGGKRRALIRWKAGSAVYPDSWVAWRGLTPDLQRDWWIRERAAKRAAEDESGAEGRSARSRS